MNERGEEHMSIAAMKQALEALEDVQDSYGNTSEWFKERVDALRQAIEQAEHELATILPDGSAFAVMSSPLPKDHWLYAERQYNDGEYEPVELGNPILTHELRDAVVSAVRYAIRGATNCGKDIDFDPDALVQNAVYALCGPYGQVIKHAEQTQPVAHTLNCVCGATWDIKADGSEEMVNSPNAASPQRKPLTDEELDTAITHERDDLLDHIYEYTTVAEGIIERVRKLARRAIEAAYGVKGEA